MKFGATHIELEHEDVWLMPRLGSHVGYDRLTDLYWNLEACLQETLAVEFEVVTELQSQGLALEDALEYPQPAQAESTRIATKLIALHSVLVNYAEVDAAL